MENAIYLKNVKKNYKLYRKPLDRLLETFHLNKGKTKQYEALKGIDIQFNKGDSIGVLGTNGAGKSTLLKIITGVVTPSEGECIVNGSVSALLELNAGFDNELTGIENIFLKATILGYDKEDFESKLDDIVQFADLGEHIYQPIRTYSSGMKSRLGFSIAVHTNPDILIIDEALAVGDETFRLKCLNRIREFKEANKTILFVSHSIGQVRAFCNKAVWLKNGKVEAYGDVKEVSNQYEEFLKEEKEKLKKKRESEKSHTSLTKSDYVVRTSFDFYNESGEKCRDFSENESIFITLGVEFKQPLEGATFHFAILDGERNTVYSTLLLEDGYLLEESYGESLIELKLPSVPLLAGRYALVTVLRDRSGLLEFYLTTHQYFEISNQESDGVGFVKIPYEVKQKILLKK